MSVISRRPLWCAFFLVVPVLAYYFYGICPINQDESIDPWFYTGYANAFVALQRVFGWPYYAVRFAANIPAYALVDWFGSLRGYMVSRYLLILLAGIPLTLWVDRRFGWRPAVVTFLFFLCNPIFLRPVLWEYTQAYGIPYAIAGISAWLLAAPRPLFSRFMAGAAMFAAMASHVFLITAVGAFVLVALVQRVRKREFAALALYDILLPSAGALACLGVGYALYVLKVGVFDPTVLVSVQINAISAGHDYNVTHHTAFMTWGPKSLYMYVCPALLCLTAALLRRRLLATDHLATIWWFAFIYQAFYFGYQFFLKGFVVETYYYFDYLSVAICVLMALWAGLVSELDGRQRGITLLLGLTAVSPLVAMPIFGRLYASGQLPPQSFGSGVFALVAGGIAIVIVTSITLAAPRLRWAGGLSIAAGLVLVQGFSFWDLAHKKVFQAATFPRERGVYRVATDVSHIFAAYSTPERRLRGWYRTQSYSLGSAFSVMLLDTINPAFSLGGMPQIGEYEVKRLREPQTAYVLVLAEKKQDTVDGEAALSKAGFQTALEFDRRLGRDPYFAYARLLRLVRDK